MNKLILLVLLAMPSYGYDYVSVADHDGDFNAAAIFALNDVKSKQSASLYGHVYVPAGNYCLTEPTIEAFWHIAPGAEFHCQNNHPNGIDNISYLTGDIYKLSSRGRNSAIVFGDTDFQPYVDIRNSVTPGAAAKLSVVGEKSGAIVGYASTHQLPFSEGSIAIQGYCNNTSLDKQNCWAGYFESIRHPEAGAVTTLEITTVNYGQFDPYKRILPSGNYGANSGISAGINISGSTVSGPYKNEFPEATVGAAIVLTPGTSGMGFDAGIVCLNRALKESTAKECIRMGVDQKLMWHGSGFNPKGSLTSINNNGNGELHISIWAEGSKKVFKFTKDGIVMPSGKLISD